MRSASPLLSSLRRNRLAAVAAFTLIGFGTTAHATAQPATTLGAAAPAAKKANAPRTSAMLKAGPMIGATSMRQVKLWVQASAETNAIIEYWEADKVSAVMRSKPQRLVEETDFVGQFELGLLEPARAYGYRVLFDGTAQAVPQSLGFKTQALWQWRTDAPDWKLAFGSCAFVNDPPHDRPGRPYGGPPEAQRIYTSMAEQKPDLTLWGGDYLYFRETDDDSERGLRYRWQYDRATPTQQVLLRTGSHISIWDDHEYGPNDSNQSYPLKGEALRLFKQYWANPNYGLPELPGTFTTHRFNDVEFFLTDNRYYRDHDKLKDPNKSMLGAAQLRWLKNALLASTSPIKIIVSGSQVTNERSRVETWRNFPEEQADFLKFLREHDINGVLIFSGDRHFTQLLKNNRPGTYPLYELTCSPLTSGVATWIDHERDNPQIVDGTFVAERNFCTVDFQGDKKNRKLVLRSFSTLGKMLWEREIAVAELQVPSAK